MGGHPLSLSLRGAVMLCVRERVAVFEMPRGKSEARILNRNPRAFTVHPSERDT